tara:strand:- start:958 stop:1614 length:657 start_codon:yes stop_codon:yes gene_type:complete
MIKIQTIHKSGSSLQSRVYKHINSTVGECIDFSRINTRKEIDWLGELQEVDIIVLRNPINRLISAYYSFGWTHTDVNFSEEQFKRRKLIQSLSLSDWVVHKGRLTYDRNVVRDILSLDKPKIIRYEDIMDHPKNFISLIVKQINRPDLLESVYKRFKDEFIFNHKDLSDDIINKGVMSHKRTLNHNEYLEKLNESDLQVINDIMGDVLKQYNKIVSFP